MSTLVKVQHKGQVTIPTRLRRQAGIAEGDLKKGRTFGPFNTADEMIASMKAQLSKRAAAAKKTQPSR
jgi:hypothetical protein